MSNIFIGQSKSSRAKSSRARKSKRKVRMISGIVLPKKFLLIWHNQQDDKVVIKHQTGVVASDCEHPNHLVTAVNLSDLSVYFCFLPEEEQINAYTQLINMIAKVSHESLCEHGGNLMPLMLKKAYLRAVQFFKTLSSGDIVTDVFVSKLSTLVRKIWHHSQNYLDYCRRHQLANRPSLPMITLEPTTSYLC